MTPTELRSTILGAFADVPYPGDDRIVDTLQDDEGVVEYFRGRPPTGHAPADLRRHDSALSFLTPDALHYYLPAFLAAVVEDPVASDVLSQPTLTFGASFKYAPGGYWLSVSQKDGTILLRVQ
ncbi:MAG TPA: hypothetical protein VEA69_11660 [Tepidisphaeraceae bacterium]|nr:hypothetical protein [Tepidisphaeraceae bacterium]